MNLFKSKNVSIEEAKEKDLDAREKQLKKDVAAFELEKDIYSSRKSHRNLVTELQKDYDTKKLTTELNALKDKKEFEHEFHSKKAEKKTELATMTKEVEVKKELMEEFNKIEDVKKTAMKEKYEAIIEEKDATIEKLDGIVKVLATKLPDVNLKNMNINVDASK